MNILANRVLRLVGALFYAIHATALVATLLALGILAVILPVGLLGPWVGGAVAIALVAAIAHKLWQVPPPRIRRLLAEAARREARESERRRARGR